MITAGGACISRCGLEWQVLVVAGDVIDVEGRGGADDAATTAAAAAAR